MPRHDPDGVAEGAGRVEGDVAVEAVPPALVALGQGEQGGPGVEELVLGGGTAVDQLHLDVLG